MSDNEKIVNDFNKKIEDFAKVLIKESLLVNSDETKVSQVLSSKELGKWIFKAEVIKNGASIK